MTWARIVCGCELAAASVDEPWIPDGSGGIRATASDPARTRPMTNTVADAPTGARQRGSSS